MLDLIANANPEWTAFIAFKDNVEGTWLLWIVVFLIIASIATVFKRIKTTYKIKKHDVKIIFDYCDVLSGQGHRVIEISNTLCLDDTHIGQHNDLALFKKRYKKVNPSLNLGEILRESVDDFTFKPIKAGIGREKRTYQLGAFADVDFYGDKYIFATSINRDDNNVNITKNEDYTAFLASFWVNLSKQDWKEEQLRIPVFSGGGKVTYDTKMKIYYILLTFIANVKSDNIPCKELRICVCNDKENSKDLSTFRSLAQYIDDFATASASNGKAIGQEMPAVVQTAVDITQTLA